MLKMSPIEKAIQELENNSDYKERITEILQPLNHVKDLEESEHLLLPSWWVNVLNVWLVIPVEDCDKIREIVQDASHATQIFDDIHDNAEFRCGKPCAHKEFGMPITVNASIFAYFNNLKRLVDLNNNNALKIYTRSSMTFWTGQGLDIAWRQELKCPTELDYIRMTMKRSEGFIMVVYKLMELFSTFKKDLTKLCSLLGIFSQIYCDLKYFQVDENDADYCKDLKRGKFSFPIIHAINNSKFKEEIFGIMRRRSNEKEVKKFFVSILENSGSLEYTRKFLKDLLEEIFAEMADFSSNSELADFLKSKVSY